MKGIFLVKSQMCVIFYVRQKQKQNKTIIYIFYWENVTLLKKIMYSQNYKVKIHVEFKWNTEEF